MTKRRSALAAMACGLAFCLTGVSTRAGQGKGTEKMSDVKAEAWAAVSKALDQAHADGVFGPEGGGLEVWLADGKRLFAHAAGPFRREKVMPVGSAAKWFTGATLMALVEKGALGLDDTTGRILGWKAQKGEITLAQLLSFTSGFAASPLEAPRYLYDPQLSLADCTRQIYEEMELAGPPGAFFAYGPVHLVIAGRMAEVVTASPWPAVFKEHLLDPLGIEPKNAFFNPPNQLAGMLWTSLESYSRLVKTYAAGGMFEGRRILAEKTIQAQLADRRPPGSDARFNPFSQRMGRDFHYGLALWLETADPADPASYASMLTASSQGGFGWYPWWDVRKGYAAILGMHRRKPSPGFVDSFNLKQRLVPLIEKAL